MACDERNTVTTTYMVVDGEGRTMTTGLQGPEVCDEAALAAQRIADTQGRPVWLVAADGDEDDQGERYDPAVEVEAYVATETSTGVEGGVDVTVTVTLGEVELDGEVTLVRSDVDGSWSSWGAPDHWVSGDLLNQLRARLGRVEQIREVLGEVEAAARAVACESQS